PHDKDQDAAADEEDEGRAYLHGRKVSIPQIFIELGGYAMSNGSRQALFVDVSPPHMRSYPTPQLRDLRRDPDALMRPPDGKVELWLKRPRHQRFEAMLLPEYYSKYERLTPS